MTSKQQKRMNVVDFSVRRNQRRARPQRMRLLSERAVAEIINVDEMIAWTDEAFRVSSSGQGNAPLRAELFYGDQSGVLFAMPASVCGRSVGVKVVGSVACTDRAERSTTCFLLIWDASSLRPRGLIAADGFNEHRTAAGLAAATRLLARPDSTVHTVYGAGKLAFNTVLYIARICPIQRVFLVSRGSHRLESLAQHLREDQRLSHVEVIVGIDNHEAARAADVITTITTSTEPVFDGNAVRPGTHINLAGAFRPDAREMDDAVAARANFWCDNLASCTERAGDVVLPFRSGALSLDRIKGEIGAVMTGAVPGRGSEGEITVFKSLGAAVQDVVLGSRLLEAAEASGVGVMFCEETG